MKSSLFVNLSALATMWTIGIAEAAPYSSKIDKIIKAAKQDGIDLPSLPFASEAFDSIIAIGTKENTSRYTFSNASRIDVHVHVVPDFFRHLAPYAAGILTPEWNVSAHLQAMVNFRK